MTFRSATGFAGAATVAAAAAALALLSWTEGGDGVALSWAAAGFLSMALPGIAFGAWLAHEHGRSGSRFVIALGAGFFVKLVLASILAFVAARSGGSAARGLLPGLAAGFIPVTAVEMMWFALVSNGQALGPEARR